MKVSIVTTTVLGLASSYAYAQQLDTQSDVQLDAQPALSSSELPDTQIPNNNDINPSLQANNNNNNNEALLVQQTSGGSSSNSETRLINIKVLLDKSNGGELESASRFLGFDIPLNPVNPTTAKYNSLISPDTPDPDADVLRSGARDLKGKAFYLGSGTVRGPEPGVMCRVISPEGELTESLPFEARDTPVRASGILCAETASLLEEAKKDEESGAAIA